MTLGFSVDLNRKTSACMTDAAMSNSYTLRMMRSLQISGSVLQLPFRKVFEVLDVCAMISLIPFAFQADLWVLWLERMGCRKPASWWMAVGFTVTSSFYGFLAFCWVPLSVFNPLGLTLFQSFLPPTENFEIIVRIDTQRPLQLLYAFAVCCTCAVFCLATLLSLLFTTCAKICVTVPLFSWCTVLFLMLKASSTEAQQGVGA